MTISVREIETPAERTEEAGAMQVMKLECRICGRLVFTALPVMKDGKERGPALVELTCSRGHSDRYDPALLKLAESKTAGREEVRRAAAGMG